MGQQFVTAIFDDFEGNLQDALGHLYDPLYQPSSLLWSGMGIDPQRGMSAIRVTVLEGIERLKPDASAPRDSRAWRFYKLLSYRYKEGLTQEATAEHLGITTRHLREEQKKAVRVLGRLLWQDAEPEASQTGAPDWSSQLEAELAWLQEKNPAAVTDVGEAVQAVVQIALVLNPNQHIDTEVDLAETDAEALIHPSALRELLLAAITALLRVSSGEVITLRCTPVGQIVRIVVRGCLAHDDDALDLSLARGILTAFRGTLKDLRAGKSITLLIDLPALRRVDQATVLVVDDNEDLVDFYRSYVAGTRYKIIHVPRAKELFSSVEEISPDVIVLDVLLPDIDGWELLVRLHNHAATRSTPIVVCSVIRDEELAMALGAAFYLAKPVRRREFVAALDRVTGGDEVTTAEVS